MSESGAKRTYFRLLDYLVPVWHRMTLLIVCSAIFASLNGISLALIPPFLHIVFDQRGIEAPTAAAAPAQGIPLPSSLDRAKETGVRWVKGKLYEGRPIIRLERFCIIFLILMLVKNIFGYLSTYMTISLEQSVLFRIRNDLYGKTQMLPLSFFAKHKTGHLISRITNDVTNLRGIVVGSLASIIQNGLSAIIAIAIVFLTS